MLHRHLTMVSLVVAGAWFLGPQIAVRSDQSQPVAIGTTISSLRFKDIRYVARSLDDLGEQKAYVLVFTNVTCPVAQKYWPKLKRLDAELRERGVQFVAVNSAADDSI